ncbi:MAG: zinc-binding dehydrogenase [Pseudomonadota bacterium]|nr:zinc-binding dehydrogenase [Pseudomonadota bacterium]
MQGVVFMGDRKLEFMEFSDPKPGPDEVVLEIKASGMCGSDLKFYRASGGASALGLGGDGSPVIAGHEPCGDVVEIGKEVDPRQVQLGQRVMVHHYKGCGVCNHCVDGWGQLCREGIVVYGATGHGAHAQYMKVPVSTLVPLSESLTHSEGAAISCGTGTAYAALRRLDISSGDTIAIFGQGPVGLSATQLAAAMGAQVIAIDISADRLSRAGQFGAEVVLDPTQENVVDQIRELTDGIGANLSLECSSAPTARLAAVQCVRTWGSACFVGEGGDVTIDVSNDMLRRQVTIIGSWTFSVAGQAECARFIVENEIDVDALFTDRYTLSQAEEAYTVFDRQQTGKGVFEF